MKHIVEIIKKQFLHKLSWYRQHIVIVLFTFFTAYFGTILLLKVILKPIAIAQLENMLSAKVQVKSAEFTFLKLVSLTGVKVLPNENFPDQTPILSADKVLTKFSLSSILKFNPQLKTVKISNCDINVIYCSKDNIWNISGIKFNVSKNQTAVLPKIELNNIAINYFHRDNDKNILIGSLPVSLAATEYIEGIKNYGIYVGIDETKGFGSGRIYGSANTVDNTTNISLSGEIKMNRPILQGNQWDMTNIQFVAQLCDSDFTINRFSFNIDGGASLVLKGGLSLLPNNPKFYLKTDIKNVNISDKPQKNNFIYSDELFGPISKEINNFFQGYKPQGKYSLSADVNGSLLDLENCSRQAVVSCLGGSAIYEKFPYKLDKLNGDIKISDKVITIERLLAEHNGSRLVLNSQADTSSNRKVSLKISTDNIKLDDDLYLALDDNTKKLWFSFAPTGNARGVYTYEKVQNKWTVSVDFDLFNGQAIFQYLPYPLKYIKGKITFADNCLIVENAVSQNQENKITINGIANNIQSENPICDVMIDAENIPIDSNLIHAIPYEISRNFQRFKIQGNPNAKIHFKSVESKRPADYLVEADITAKDISFFNPPLNFENVKLSITMTPERIAINSFDSDFQNGFAQLSGELFLTADEIRNNSYNMTLNAKNIDISKNLFAAISAESEQVYNNLRLSGKIDLEAVIREDVNQAPVSEIVVNCRSINAVPVFLPYPVKNITGQITILQDITELKNISGIFANSIIKDINSYDFKLDGKVHTKPCEPIKAELAFDIQNIAFDKNLEIALPDKLRSVYSQLKPTGSFSIKSDNFTFDAKDNKLTNLSADMQIKTSNLSVNNNIVENLNCDVNVGIEIKDSLLWEFTGKIFADNFKVKHKIINNATADFYFDSNNDAILSKNITCLFYDGMMIGNMKIDLNKKRPILTSQFGFDGIDIEKLSSAEPNETEISKYLKGKLSGSASFDINLQNSDEKSGRMIMNINDVFVNKTSLIGKILEILEFKNVSDIKFNLITLDGHIDNSIFYIDRLDMHSPDISLSGSGNYNMPQKLINLELRAADSRKQNLNIFQSLQRATGYILVKITVSGAINNPDIKTQPLPFIKDIFNILGTEKIKK